MSGAVWLRAPVRHRTVARHYLGMLGSGGGAWGVAAALLLALTGSIPVNGSDAFTGVRTFIVLAFFLPLLHWREAGHAGALDGAMPLRGTRHDLIRIACGALWACAAVLVVVGVSMLPSLLGHGPRFGGYPWWYPLPAVSAGLTLYLLGSAVWLRSEKPGRMLLLAYLLQFLAGLALRFRLGPVSYDSTYLWAMTAAVRSSSGGLAATAQQWLLGAALWLGIACAAVWLSVTADRWLDPLRSTWTRRTSGMLRRLAPPRTRHASAAGRRPPRLGAVFAGEVRLLRRRMVWPAALFALWLWTQVSLTLNPANTAEPAVFDPWGFGLLGTLALLPLLVWLDERGPRRDHAGALPVGAATLRMMRVAAGGAWVGLIVLALVALLAAAGIAAGRVPSLQSVPMRVWVGVPGATLMVYLLGSVPVLLSSRHPVLATALFWLSFETLERLGGPPGWDGWQFSPWAALAPLGRTSGPVVPWHTPLAIWLPLAGLAVAGAAALGAHLDRTGRLPRARPAGAALGAAAGGAA